mmetsp:Transcript_71433/g.149275  ORF Transcript_71433/g.149275 Transcript_71433/m.149275 type:complete len:205 (+) Transcript_71433:1585-2199(+)
MAAFVLNPKPRPSLIPLAKETIDFSTAKSSTASTLGSELTTKLGLLKISRSIAVLSGFAHPRVASAKCPAMTSPVSVPPMRTAVSMPKASATTWLPNFKPPVLISTMSLESTTATASFLTSPAISTKRRLTTSWRSTKMRTSLPLAASAASAVARMLGGSLTPRAYFGFSWWALTISVRRIPSTISSFSHQTRSVSNFGLWRSV